MKKRFCFLKIVFPFVIGMLLINIISVNAQTVELLKDINTSGNSNPNVALVYSNQLLFTANDGIHGYQLWSTDGTASGTGMLKQINPNGDAFYQDPVEFSNEVFFKADDGEHGKELWKTDGTEAGTQLLKDINTSGDGDPNTFIVFNDHLFFTADNGTNGREWWTTDGTPSGTQLFVDNSSVSGYPSWPYIYNDELFFNYNDGSTGVELWKTDGTPGGTNIVKDINQQAMPSSTPVEFKEYDGLLYFSADDGVHGRELWVTDGTTDGTQLFKDINPSPIGSSPRFFTVYNNKMYFEASDGIHGFEFWVTDGTEAGTEMVKDLNPGGNGGLLRMVEYYGLLWFSAEDGMHGRELWVSDGTTEGTNLFYDFNESGSGLPGYLTVQPAPVEYNGDLYLVADDGQNGWELWLTDGTTEGTRKITPIGATVNSPLGNTNEMTVFKEAMYFPAEYTDVGKEMWRVVGSGAVVTDFADELEILEVYPNPCSGTTCLRYQITDIRFMLLDLYEISGRKIKRMMNEEMMAGEYEMIIDVSDLSPGVYFIQLFTEGNTMTKKLIIK